MQHGPDQHHRRSLRLPGYDYRRAGAYFVTIVTQGRECLFGEVADGEMWLNDAGRSVERWWAELSRKFPNVTPGIHIVMPNHAHGIIITDPVGADLCVCPEGAHAGAPLPKIVQWFKTMTTNEYVRGVKTFGWSPFPGRMWQRNYFEHIIRDEESLDRICEYVVNNPATWTEDRENPAFKEGAHAGAPLHHR